jgi:hypothetical protein
MHFIKEIIQTYLYISQKTYALLYAYDVKKLLYNTGAHFISETSQQI